MLKFLKEYVVMTLGLAVFVFGWVAFLNPHEITGGGIAGLASVIHYGIPAIPVSYAKFVIDALLLVFGFIVLGRGFGIKTIYCVVASFFLFHFMPRIPGLIEFFSGIEENIINALIGGALSGTGIAIILTQGGSTGGTDIIAMAINKYKNISPGRIYLVCDSLVIISILLLPHKSLQDVVYGYIEIIAFSYAVDMLLTGSKQSIQTLILSPKNEEIAALLQAKLVEGNSEIHCVEWTLQGDQKALMVVSRKGYCNEITRLAKSVDTDAFMMTVPVTAVYSK